MARLQYLDSFPDRALLQVGFGIGFVSTLSRFNALPGYDAAPSNIDTPFRKP